MPETAEISATVIIGARKNGQPPGKALGTVIAPGVVITTNHWDKVGYGLPEADQMIIKGSTGTSDLFIGGTATYEHEKGDNPADIALLATNPAFDNDEYATLASQEEIAALQSGDLLDFVYDNDDTGWLSVGSGTYVGSEGSYLFMQVNEGEINEGDSGGGVFHNGNLVGVIAGPVKGRPGVVAVTLLPGWIP